MTITLSACSKGDYPRPTRDFYVNDFADALLPGSRLNFVSEGERMYELTEDEPEGGAQVVVATFLVENEEDAADIDKTELFREWRIGKNDMGILILLIFCDMTDEESQIEERFLVSAEIEIGYRMEQYLTAARAGQLLDECLYNPEWDGSIDMGLGELYYEILTIIYTKAYGYESFNYDMETYRQTLINTEDSEPLDSMSFIVYLLSPYSSGWTKFFTILPFIIFSLCGGGIFVARKRGGGGSSGGYGVRR